MTDISTDATWILDLCKDLSETASVDNDVWELIVPYIEMFPLLSAAIRSKMEYKAMHKLVHSESRSEWELLMKLFFEVDSDRHYHLRTE